MTQASGSSWWRVAALGASLAGAVVGWLSARPLEVLWDEQVDQDIALGLRENPLTGEQPPLDASQLRLPMYVNAAVFALAGRTSLDLSRAVSLAAGAATVLSAAALARILFGPLAAALSAVLLAFSPYFLSFSRISMTEGDVFFSLFTTAAVWAFVRYLQRATPGRWLAAALTLGLAIGAKFFGIFLVPVYVVLASSSGPARDIDAAGRRRDVRRVQAVLAAALIFLVATVGMGAAAGRPVAAGPVRVGVGAWLIGLAAWGWIVMSVWRRRALASGRMQRLAALVGLALLTCAVLMPVHVIEPAIARELARRCLRWDHRVPLALWSDHLRLYAGILLVKLTAPLGVVSVVALVYAGFREREDGRWRPAILCIVFYVVLLCFLPLRQTFYLMAVYPLVVVVTAGFLVEAGQWFRRAGTRRRARAAWMVAVLGLPAHLGWRTWQAFPHYHLYGHDLTGDRWLGAESRGYRNLIQTPSDGVGELVAWCRTSGRVRPGDRVVSYLWEERILRGHLPASPPFVFIPRGLSQDTDAVPPGPSIEDADFVLLHINNFLGYGDRPPDTPSADVLRSRFEVAHAVRRGPLEVGWVYARKPARR
jgi:hypothetical protein